METQLCGIFYSNAELNNFMEFNFKNVKLSTKTEWKMETQLCGIFYSNAELNNFMEFYFKNVKLNTKTE